MKKIILTCVAMLLCFSGCVFPYQPWVGNRPCDQPGSTWRSEDGSISFTVEENGTGDGIGVMNIDDQEIDIIFGRGVTTDIYIYYADSRIGNTLTEPNFEYWVGDFRKSDAFTITVMNTTYYSEGQTIAFYREAE